MVKGSKIFSRIIFVLLAFLILAMLALPKFSREYIYKKEYSEHVEKFAIENGLNPYFVYSVIKTESNFVKNAESNVGARGLMQLMPDAFDWVKFKSKDSKELTFDSMYEPRYNIEYGCFLLGFLYERYGDERLALAAYHGGMTQVDNWLSDKNLSSDGKTLDVIPSNATAHYINKVMKNYSSYKNLYENE